MYLWGNYFKSNMTLQFYSSANYTTIIIVRHKLMFTLIPDLGHKPLRIIPIIAIYKNQ